MQNSIDYFFTISEQAALANDGEGNPSKCYLKISFKLKRSISKNIVEKERSRNEDKALTGAAHFLRIDKSLLKLISEREYMANTDVD